MRKIDKERLNFLEGVEARFLKILDKLENQFLRAILKELETVLIIKDGKIENVTKNHVNLHKLGFFQEQFRKKNVSPVVSWVATQLIKINNINYKYFNKVADVKSIEKRVHNNALLELGIKQNGNRVTIAKNSFLDQITKFETPYLAIRNLSTQAIAQGMSIENFKRLIKTEIKPDGKYGKVKHHFKTIASDVFSRHDRNVQLKYANELDFKTFIYEGGTIESTRQFCRDRNDKVFTREEAEAWKSIDWDGKNEPYNPLTDMGGHNCRHFTSWIGKKEAIRRRPDLKNYFENLN